MIRLPPAARTLSKLAEVLPTVPFARVGGEALAPVAAPSASSAASGTSSRRSLVVVGGLICISPPVSVDCISHWTEVGVPFFQPPLGSGLRRDRVEEEADVVRDRSRLFPHQLPAPVLPFVELGEPGRVGEVASEDDEVEADLEAKGRGPAM